MLSNISMLLFVKKIKHLHQLLSVFVVIFYQIVKLKLKARVEMFAFLFKNSLDERQSFMSKDYKI